MYKFIVNFILFLSLTGCATHAPYGNFVEKSAEINMQKMVSDTVEKIIELYPPAKTRFELQQTTPDAFGMLLVHELREHGYAILEFTSEIDKIQQYNKSPEGLPFRYIFDQFTDTNMYRVTVMVGNESLTRPYLQENNSIIPVGYWVRKE